METLVLTPDATRPDPRDRWSELSQAERDTAYDNNKAVPHSASLVEARNIASTRVRASLPGAMDVPYANGERTCFDLFPAAAYAAPCLVFIHGGYWQRNSREMFAAVAEGFARRGWSVAIPGYTLAPNASLTQIVSEIRQALDWLDAEGHACGIQGPVVLSGWSAGAQLAAMTLDHPRVAAGIAISGVYDLAPIRDTYLNTALQLQDEEVEALSPLRRPVIHKPLAIAYGTAELPALVHDARRFHARRNAEGAVGPLVPVEGADHFSILGELCRPDGQLVETARALVKGHSS